MTDRAEELAIFVYRIAREDIVITTYHPVSAFSEIVDAIRRYESEVRQEISDAAYSVYNVDLDSHPEAWFDGVCAVIEKINDHR